VPKVLRDLKSYDLFRETVLMDRDDNLKNE